MESEIGIEGYLTTTPGVGGRIKASPEDFIVDEIPAGPPPSDEGPFTIATLTVRNWETNRLVRELARRLRISRKRIGFAGTKDKRALSTRRVSFERVSPEAIAALHVRDITVQDVHRAAKPLEIGDLLGNRFRIVVRDLAVSGNRTSEIVEETSRQVLACGGFPSFFGIQRFGSIRPITHAVGRHIVRGDFREAVRVYVGHPLPGEDPDSFRARQAYEETGDVGMALRLYPRAYSFERAILNHLAVRPDDYVGALQRLPSNLLMMFVHAYQSFLFNRVLSERMRRGLPVGEPVAGDLVLPADAEGLPDRNRLIDVTCDNLEKAARRCRAGGAWVSAILFGSQPEFAGGEPGWIEKDVVRAEGLRPDDFIVPELPRISSKGTRREILAPTRDLRARVEGGSLHLSFELSRGSYATSLVREYTKSPG